MNSTVKKYAIGFAVFMLYYLIAENLRNKSKVVNKLANIGNGPA